MFCAKDTPLRNEVSSLNRFYWISPHKPSMYDPKSAAFFTARCNTCLQLIIAVPNYSSGWDLFAYQIWLKSRSRFSRGSLRSARLCIGLASLVFAKPVVDAFMKDDASTMSLHPLSHSYLQGYLDEAEATIDTYDMVYFDKKVAMKYFIGIAHAWLTPPSQLTCIT